MTHRRPNRTAWRVAAIAGMALFAAGHVMAAEQPAQGIRVVSSDATARFLPIEIHQSVVIDLPSDVKDVLVAHPETVQAVARTSRRFYLIATGLGETNVYFFDAAGQQIGALDIGVISSPPPKNPDGLEAPKQVVVVFKGGSEPKFEPLSCTLSECFLSQYKQ